MFSKKNINKKSIFKNFFNYLKYSFFFTSLKINHDSFRELIWTILPSIILIFLAIPSLYNLYHIDYLIQTEEPYITIRVIGNQWFWTYEYFNSTTNFNNIKLKLNQELSFDSYMISEDYLYPGQLRLLETDYPLLVPMSARVDFLVTSSDVLHCWAVPSLGIKIDACPGRINQVHTWVLRSGEFYGQCSEICGINHGFMPISIISV